MSGFRMPMLKKEICRFISQSVSSGLFAMNNFVPILERI